MSSLRLALKLSKLENTNINSVESSQTNTSAGQVKDDVEGDNKKIKLEGKSDEILGKKKRKMNSGSKDKSSKSGSSEKKSYKFIKTEEEFPSSVTADDRDEDEIDNETIDTVIENVENNFNNEPKESNSYSGVTTPLPSSVELNEPALLIENENAIVSTIPFSEPDADADAEPTTPTNTPSSLILQIKSSDGNARRIDKRSKQYRRSMKESSKNTENNTEIEMNPSGQLTDEVVMEDAAREQQESILMAANEIHEDTVLPDPMAVSTTPMKKRKKRMIQPNDSLDSIMGLNVSHSVDSVEPVTTSRYQSNRTAAMIAKTKFKVRTESISSMTSKQESHPMGYHPDEKTESIGHDLSTDDIEQTTKKSNKDKSGTAMMKTNAKKEGEMSKKNSSSTNGDTTPGAEVDALEWVQCDECGKWRSKPRTVDTISLPDKWFCYMNTWDERFNDCSSPEETVPVVVPGPKGAKHRNVASKKDVDEGNLDASKDIEFNEGTVPTGLNSTDGRLKGNRNRKKAMESSLELAKSGDGTGDSNPNLRNDQNDGSDIADANYVPKRGRSSLRNQLSSNATPNIVPINWVMCNKCKKWRKVAEFIDVDSLPDTWLCSMNTWSIAYSRCSSKQESDEQTLENANRQNIYGNGNNAMNSNMGMNESSGPSGKIRRNVSGSSQPANQSVGYPGSNGGNVVGTKKVTQWVQCDRKNCKKWRKVPMSIDMTHFPTTWYCELNTWDTDVASCDIPEDSDSDTEHQNSANSRSQLILSNAKGPGSLSYRRIIFGNDGKVRNSYGDKNRNGYGIFSYTEVHKQNTSNEEYVEPTRRINYWWSSCYNDTNTQSHSSNKHASSVGEVIMKPMIDSYHIPSPNYLIDTLLRMYNKSGFQLPQPSTYPPRTAWPKKISTAWKLISNMSLLTRLHNECIVIRSAFLSSDVQNVIIPKRETDKKENEIQEEVEDVKIKLPEYDLTRLRNRPISISNLFMAIRKMKFIKKEVDACREYMDMTILKLGLRRLEMKNEVEITCNLLGELLIEILIPVPIIIKNIEYYYKMVERTQQQPSKHILPLKLRKYFEKSKEEKLSKIIHEIKNETVVDANNGNEMEPENHFISNEIQKSLSTPRVNHRMNLKFFAKKQPHLFVYEPNLFE